MHFSRAKEPYLILHCNDPIKNQLYSLELSDLSKDDHMVNKIRVPVLPEFQVVGSCKGLLCLRDLGLIRPLLPVQVEVRILTLGSPAWRNLGKLPRRIIHEQFREIATPGCGDLLDKIHFHLMDLGGCVSAAVFNDYEQIEIWITKDYDVKES
ncbi:hypothetical protein QYF36_004004 [Acer negundo]|nr:hypothetical protein QYF36_004004 [Acer negundo]